MLLSIARLLRREEPASCGDELARLRARFCAAPSARESTRAAIESAERLRTLRNEMSAAFSKVSACGACARGRPEPNGHWAGGSCCGAHTLDLFTPTEVASLKLAGISARDLERNAPRGDHAGCAFRAEDGCTLTPEQRPNICVRYVCLELRAELIDTPEWKRVSSLGANLRDELTRFEHLIEG